MSSDINKILDHLLIVLRHWYIKNLFSKTKISSHFCSKSFLFRNLKIWSYKNYWINSCKKNRSFHKLSERFKITKKKNIWYFFFQSLDKSGAKRSLLPQTIDADRQNYGKTDQIFLLKDMFIMWLKDK